MPIRLKTPNRGLLKGARACFLVCAWAAALPAGPTRAAFDHGGLDAILKARVDAEGRVDYRGLKGDRAALDAYVARLGRVAPETLNGWSRADQMAFYLNAYNAITFQVVIDHYPPKGLGLIFPRLSIRNIPGVWDKIRTPVAGAELTLNEIEHEILRPRFKDARVHAAIVCASIGCPILRNEAYVGARLEEQLEDAARRFARHPEKNAVDPRRRIVTISPIFDWFKEDFESYAEQAPTLKGRRGDAGRWAGALGFLIRYGDPAHADFLRGGDYRVRLGDYDWSLNDWGLGE